MAIHNLDHYLIVSNNPNATKNFYEAALGLINGVRPDMGVPGNWLYGGNGRPLVHIVPASDVKIQNMVSTRRQYKPAHQTGAIDHIAFAATDIHTTIVALERCDADFEVRPIAADNIQQIFVYAPDGITIELNFFLGNR